MVTKHPQQNHIASLRSSLPVDNRYKDKDLTMPGETSSSGGGGSSRACKGICQVLSGVTTTTVLGVLTLEQSNVHQPVHITGKLTGLTPGKHGVSICVAGDLSHGPTTCGPIFNPFGMYSIDFLYFRVH